MTQHPYTFVTVSHGVDFELLRLQARSMARYCPAGLASAIVVVENSPPTMPEGWQAALLKEYGPLAERVVFASASDLAEMPNDVAGWWTQQAVKLLVAHRVPTERYIILDAKNHLVFPLAPDFIEAPNGKPRMRRYGYEQHPLRDALERCLEYLGLAPASYLSNFMQTSTPFVMLRRPALDLIGAVQDREKKPFAQAFIDRRLTEFFLYGAYIEASAYRNEGLYEFDMQASPIVWGHDGDPAGCLAQIDLAESQGLPVFAVHRTAIANLDSIGRQVIAQFWRRRGLFNSTADGLAWLQTATAR